MVRKAPPGRPARRAPAGRRRLWQQPAGWQRAEARVAPEGFGEGDASLQATVGRDGFGGFAEFDAVGRAQRGRKRNVGVKGVVLGFEGVGDIDEFGGRKAGGPSALVGE